MPAVGEELSDAMVVFACAPVTDENKHKKETEKVLVLFVCRGGFYDMGSGTSMPTFHAQRTALNNDTQRQAGRWSIKINCSPSTTIGKPQQYPLPIHCNHCNHAAFNSGSSAGFPGAVGVAVVYNFNGIIFPFIYRVLWWSTAH